MAAQTGISTEVIATFDKIVRRAFAEKGDGPIPMVSAFAARKRLVLEVSVLIKPLLVSNFGHFGSEQQCHSGL